MTRILPTAVLALSVAVPALASERTYQCNDGQQRRIKQVDSQTVWLIDSEAGGEERRELLSQAVSASGVRYASLRSEWWEKGDSALLNRLGQNQVQCELVAQAVTEDRIMVQIGWRERRAFPGATLEVQLLDVSLADAPAKVISAKTSVLEVGIPLAVALPFKPAEIDRRMTYAVSVRLTQDGKLLMLNTTRNTVLTRGAGKVAEVLLVAPDKP
ncbi:YbaY family lipoprotein [Chitinilyticum litopenaei]|uniref:YbaY family lipoprotein n=1 Tax=Chitinilyticum litopenaei TaxID=1121276 RepID=UPI0003FC252F|nr:YbaY family lipoprotein [Chitinilyticum litopenaei]